MVKVYLPSRMRAAAQQQTWVEVEATTVQGVLNALIQSFPDLSTFILHNGQLNRYTRIFVNSQEVKNLIQPIAINDEIHIIQAMAGG